MRMWMHSVSGWVEPVLCVLGILCYKSRNFGIKGKELAFELDNSRFLYASETLFYPWKWNLKLFEGLISKIFNEVLSGSLKRSFINLACTYLQSFRVLCFSHSGAKRPNHMICTLLRRVQIFGRSAWDKFVTETLSCLVTVNHFLGQFMRKQFIFFLVWRS